MISELAYVDKNAKIGNNVTIEPFAYVAGNVEIGDNCHIYSHASILSGTRMGKGTKVHECAILGSEPQDLYYTGEESELIIGDDCDIRENVVIARATKKGDATRIGNNCYIMAGAHLCHDVIVGDYIVIGLHAIIAGNCKFDGYSIISNGAILNQNVHVGIWSFIQAGCRLSRDVPPYIVVKGNPARYHGINRQVMQSNHIQQKFDDRTLRHIMNAYLILYQVRTSPEDAAIRFRNEIPMGEEIQNIIEFITNSDHLLMPV